MEFYIGSKGELLRYVVTTAESHAGTSFLDNSITKTVTSDKGLYTEVRGVDAILAQICLFSHKAANMVHFVSLTLFVLGLTDEDTILDT